jgi:hypothetical protein
MPSNPANRAGNRSGRPSGDGAGDTGAAIASGGAADHWVRLITNPVYHLGRG